jgi:hypothetical protein
MRFDFIPPPQSGNNVTVKMKELIDLGLGKLDIYKALT